MKGEMVRRARRGKNPAGRVLPENVPRLFPMLHRIFRLFRDRIDFAGPPYYR